MITFPNRNNWIGCKNSIIWFFGKDISIIDFSINTVSVLSIILLHLGLGKLNPQRNKENYLSTEVNKGEEVSKGFKSVFNRFQRCAFPIALKNYKLKYTVM